MRDILQAFPVSQPTVSKVVHILRQTQYPANQARLLHVQTYINTTGFPVLLPHSS